MKESQGRVIRLADYRPPEFLIEHTALEFDLYEDHALVHATLSMYRNPQQRTDAPLVLAGQQLETLHVAVDGRALDAAEWQADEDSLTIPVVPERFELTTTVRIRPQDNHALEGLYRSRRMFCTQCEAEGFRRITWYLDRPDVMALFRTRIRAERARYPVLLSNGNRVAAGRDDDGRHWVEWEDPHPKPSYLFALVAGDLACIEDQFLTASGREVSLQIYVEDRDVDKCDHAMRSLKQAMRWDEERYGREYDLDVFMIVAVDDFNMGAMENKGLNIFNTSCVLARPEITTDAGFQRIAAIVAHEYFHNWSGNRVTCRDWFQLSLKEGFTVFRDAQFSADHGSATVKRIVDATLMRTQQFAEDAGPMAHPVRPDSYIEINNFYTLTVYEKGAEVVRMIHELLGPEAFRRGSDLYFERHDGQAVTIEHFVRAMEDASGRDLRQFRRWYEQAGTPVIEAQGEYDAAARRYRLRLRQHTPATPGQDEKQPLHVPIRVGLLGPQGPLPLGAGAPEQLIELTGTEQSFDFDGIDVEPVPSLLRDFSAPVRVDYRYSRDDLLLLMRHDDDGFSRWDAGQTLACQVLEEQIAAPVGAEPPVCSEFLDACRQLLDDRDSDPALLAQMLSLPSEAYLAEQAREVDPQAIHRGRERVRRALAAACRDELLACYEAFRSRGPYTLAPEAMARRSLASRCLTYLSVQDGADPLAPARAQYQAADNMTDRLAALTAVVHNDLSGDRSQAGELLDDFLRRYRHETLAVNLWLQVQASAPAADALERVRELLEHEVYDTLNPNKVRALVGAWAGANAVGFHRPDGLGYRFLAEQVIARDRENPQLAARLLTPLTRWRRFAAPYRDGMHLALERVAAAGGLSSDCYEVVSKSLR